MAHTLEISTISFDVTCNDLVKTCFVVDGDTDNRIYIDVESQRSNPEEIRIDHLQLFELYHALHRDLPSHHPAIGNEQLKELRDQLVDLDALAAMIKSYTEPAYSYSWLCDDFLDAFAPGQQDSAHFVSDDEEIALTYVDGDTYLCRCSQLYAQDALDHCNRAHEGFWLPTDFVRIPESDIQAITSELNAGISYPDIEKRYPEATKDAFMRGMHAKMAEKRSITVALP